MLNSTSRLSQSLAAVRPRRFYDDQTVFLDAFKWSQRGGAFSKAFSARENDLVWHLTHMKSIFDGFVLEPLIQREYSQLLTFLYD